MTAILLCPYLECWWERKGWYGGCKDSLFLKKATGKCYWRPGELMGGWQERKGIWWNEHETDRDVFVLLPGAFLLLALATRRWLCSLRPLPRRCRPFCYSWGKTVPAEIAISANALAPCGQSCQGPACWCGKRWWLSCDKDDRFSAKVERSLNIYYLLISLFGCTES